MNEAEQWRALWGVGPDEDMPAGSRMDAELAVAWQAVTLMRVLAEHHGYDRERLIGLVDDALKDQVIEDELERIEQIARVELAQTSLTHSLLAHVRAIRRRLNPSRTSAAP